MSAPSPDLLAVDISQVEAVHVVALRGELDLSSSDRLSHALAGVAAVAAVRVVVDLSELTFIDSSGVRVLMSAANSIDSSGGVLALAAPTSTVQMVFDILHLSDLVAVEATVEEALARVTQFAPGEAGRPG